MKKIFHLFSLRHHLKDNLWAINFLPLIAQDNNLKFVVYLYKCFVQQSIILSL